MYSSTLGYYGKLPVSEEFIRCQASGVEIEELDHWLREGMYHAKSTLGSSWSMDFAQADAWGFLYLPRGGDRFLTGFLKPSQDKAGREFPFLLYLLLKREEFRESPWCAPMHFKEFFEQSHRLLLNVSEESDLNRLQFRLQGLSPIDGVGNLSVDTRYHSELLRRRTGEHWTDLFGDFENSQRCRLLGALLHQQVGSNTSTRYQWQARFPLLPLSKEETYDLPFWIDVVARASGLRLEAGILLWNRRPSKVKPLLFVSLESPTPQLLLYLVHPESWQNGLSRGMESVEPLTDAERALLDDGDVTLEAFLHQLSGLRT